MVAGRLNWWVLLRRLIPNIIMYALAGVLAVVMNVVLSHPEYWGISPVISSWSKSVLLYNDDGVPFTIISALGAARREAIANHLPPQTWGAYDLFLPEGS